MSNAPCWQTRMEVDPRYDYAADTFDENAPLWAPNCGHPACVADQEACPNWHDWDCPVAVCHYDTAHAMCDLDAGHSGEHVFVASDEITLQFVDPAPAVPSGRPGGAG